MRKKREVLICVLIAGLLSTTASAQAVPDRDGDQATVWYLRHAGWAVRVRDALLIFDYQEAVGMEDVTDATPRTLENGLIDPAEISDLDVYVFVTHAHGDHYDPVIFDWLGEIERLTYVIGWNEQPLSHCERFAAADAKCHTMEGLRATADLGDIQIYTIDSFYNDIPEVAYLIRYGDWIVYHNGDYLADYVTDYAYLKTIVDRIDVAFVAGYPDREWPHVARAVHLAREFDVPVLYAMHFRDAEMCETFVAEVAAEGVSAEVECPTAGGQRFVVAKGSVDRGNEVRPVPRGQSVTIDGNISGSEWHDADSVAFAVGDSVNTTVAFKHDGLSLLAVFVFERSRDIGMCFPEIFLDVDNDKGRGMRAGDWWFHVSASNCEAEGESDDYSRCSRSTDWDAARNYSVGDDPVAVDTIEIRIPFDKIGMRIGSDIGLAFRVEFQVEVAGVWQPTLATWPNGARAAEPETWETMHIAN